MRMIVLILAAYLLAAWNDANANPCQIGAIVAAKAYTEGTYDVQQPDDRRLHYLVDYWGDMVTLKYDRRVAHDGVDYIANKLKSVRLRMPTSNAINEAMQEFITRECAK